MGTHVLFIKHIEDEWTLTPIGVGSYSTVYKAESNKYNLFPHTICIKKIFKDEFNEAEVKILQRLSEEKRSIKYYGCGIDEQFYYIYTEYILGESIANLINYKKEKKSSLTEQEIIELATEMALTLVFIHRNNIIHGDIKCEHIFIIKDDQNRVKHVKYIDFGLSTEISDKESLKNYSVFGTYRYMAPEVKLQNGKICKKSDVYSLGCVLIEMVGGLKKRDDHNGTLLMNYDDDGVRIIPEHVSFRLRNIIQQCVIANIDARFDSEGLYNHLLMAQNIEADESIIKPKGVEYVRHFDLAKDSIPSNVKYIILSDFNKPIDGLIPNGIKSIVLPAFDKVITKSSFPCSITYLSMPSFNQELEKGSIPVGVKHLSLPAFNNVIPIGAIPDSVEVLELQSFNFDLISSFGGTYGQKIIPGTIPLSVTKLCFNKFNKKINASSIPESVKYLDLGDEFDFHNNGGEDLPCDESLHTLICGFKFTKVIGKSFPRSVTNLQLPNYNIPLASNSIPKSVISLTLGSNFNDIDSLKYLPPSIINLKFCTKKPNHEAIKFVNPSITSVIINFKERRYSALGISEYPAKECIKKSKIEDCLEHTEAEWEIISTLGEGSYGNVRKAVKIRNSNGIKVGIYAVKRIEELDFDPIEIETLIKLNNNQYSMKYYGYGKDRNGRIHIYMEYIEGAISIDHILKNGVKFNRNEILKLFKDIVIGLQSIHEQQVIHCDIKSHHILLIHNSKGERMGIKFIDFGVSKICDGRRLRGSFLGTQIYAAPEILLNIKSWKKNYFKSDIYSLGCVLLEMLGCDIKDRNDNGTHNIPMNLPNNIRNIAQQCLLFQPNIRFSTKKLVNHLYSDGQQLNKKPFVNIQLSNSEAIPNIKHLELILTSNITIKEGIIPLSVTKLSLPSFNQEIEYDSIPESVKYLDLGDEFDIQSNGGNLPNYSILTLRCGFNFTKILNLKSIPLSVTDLQLYNYNISLARNSIPESVISLTLGSNFNYIDSLTYLPLSIINLKFGTLNNFESYLANINKIVNPIISSLIINNKEIRK